MDRVNAVRGLADTFALLYPQLQGLDFRTDAPRIDVPVYLVMGRHEAPGRVIPRGSGSTGSTHRPSSGSSSTTPATGPRSRSPPRTAR
jgi:hypothetical protein